MINISISDEPKQSVVVPAQGQTRVVKSVRKPAKKVVSAKGSPALTSKKRDSRRRNKFFKAAGHFVNKYAPVAKQVFVPGGIFLKG